MKLKQKQNDVLIKTAKYIGTKITVEGNVILLYYISNREMINSSGVPLNVFTKHFPNTSNESLGQIL